MSVIQMKTKKPPASMRSRMDTMLINRKELDSWAPAPFQRPLRINEKVRLLADEIKVSGGMIPGIITLGTIGEKSDTYIIDGQHRLEAARLSELVEFIVDVRICGFDNLSDMGEEFVNLNSHLVSMRPDDVLRGLERSLPVLGVIRKNCEFVGYDNVRRGDSSKKAMVSMSAALRSWRTAQQETPSYGGASALITVKSMDVASANELCQFLNIAHSSWGIDVEYYRLWSSLNITMTMWMWRQMVTTKERSSTQRYIKISAAQFAKCMSSLSASPDYLDWLVGRNLTERDRSPCYTRIKRIFSARLKDDMPNQVIKFPAPAWVSSTA